MDADPRRDLARLDDPARLAVFGGALLERDLDDQLQEIAREATEVTGFGIALVSLVLRRVQFFRAHIGLPHELQIARSTNRCASFCQFVVASGNALFVEDAAKADFLPQNLVESYGIRAYAGEPVYVGEQIAGTLCVLDDTPRALNLEQRARLRELAESVSNRLSELATAGMSTQFVGQAMRPVFGEVSNALTSMYGCSALLRLGSADLAGLIEVMAATTTGKLSVEERERVLGVLGEAEHAVADIAERASDLDNLVRRVGRNVDAIRLLVAQTDATGTAVAEGLDSANTLAAHITKLVGGVRFDELSPVLRVGTVRMIFVSVVSIALRLLADELHGRGSSAGIDLLVVDTPQSAYLTIQLKSPGGTPELFRHAAQAIDHFARDAAGIAITCIADAIALTFPR